MVMMLAEPALRHDDAMDDVGVDTSKGRWWWLRLLAVFAGAVVVWCLVELVVGALLGSGYSRIGHVARAVGVLAGVALLWMLALRRPPRRPADYGVRLDAAGWRAGGAGALAYLVPWAAASLVVLAAPSVTVVIPREWFVLAGQIAALLVLVVLYEAIPEELVFRGLLYGTLAERWPVWVAVLGQCVLFCSFGAVIGAARTVDRLVLFALFSLTLGAIRAMTGSVMATIGFHAAFQSRRADRRVHAPSPWTVITHPRRG
jgi:membrane protease YdiL (CAAX protease family)